MTFEVWVPELGRVRVRVDGQVHEMERAGGGWWRADVAGRDYGFLLGDDETVLPDPRSAWQPDGVHEASRRYDHGAFAWTDGGWTGRALPGSVIYELHIGTFTGGGTFDSAIERLDHLVELGIDLVEVMPVNALDSPRNWGYDGVLWYAVHEPYGGPDGFKRFVDACHTRNLGVVLDVVHNHLGPSGAYLDRFGPYFGGRNIWGPSLNLDGPHSDEVRRYVIDNALMWLRDYHVDALRLDAVHALVDRRATHLLEELATEVHALQAHVGRPLTLIAESDLNDATLVTAREAGGYGLHAQWNDDVHHALHTALTGERQGYYADFDGLDAVATTLRRVFFHAGTWSSFRGRTHGRPVDPARIPADRFVVSLQNHDQVGNRATGDRLSATLPPGLLACGAALLLCGPFTPMLFMGEEWGASTPFRFFSHFPDPELRAAVRDGRYEEFAEHGWGAAEVPDPNDEETFTGSRLRWEEARDGDHARLLETYRALIALRRAEPDLTDPWLGHLDVAHDAAAGWLTLRRGAITVVVNLGAEPVELPVGGELVLAWDDAVVTGDGLRLGGRDFAVLRAC
ncbi:MAG TPA: malto-oligosyltrehalose trehalohydrolase [Pseudonocardiaceae bacterium]